MTVLTALAASLVAGSSAAQPADDSRAALFDEPRVLTRTMTWIDGRWNDGDGKPDDGFYPELGHMVTGSGWISAGVGYRRHVFSGHALVDTSAAISWRAYKMAQARFELPSLAGNTLTVGSKALWQDFTQVRYFGAGADTRERNVSDYRLQTTNLVAYAAWRPRQSIVIAAAAGWLARPHPSASAGAFDRDDPDALTVHRDDPAAALTQQPRYVHTEISAALDTRDRPSYPTRGGVLRGAWMTYRDRPRAGFSFAQSEAEAAYFLPVLGRSVLATHVWGVFTHTAGANEVPFYLLPTLGGHNTLRGFDDYRFHDRHMLVANVESRWPLLRHVDVAAFFDAGNIASRVSDLGFDRTSWGVGLRLHTSRTTLARFDVGHSREGWRVILKLSDPIRLRRMETHTADIPFVP